jgi:hemerythrin-like metal-binding protein
MNNYFVWHSSLAMNVPEIDEQHRYLIGLINSYHQSLTGQAPREQLADVLTFLAGYVKQHFATEENMMQETLFPDRAAHVAEHEALSARVAEMIRQFESGTLPHDSVLAEFLRDWLTQHILKIDRKLADWLTSKQGVARQIVN